MWNHDVEEIDPESIHKYRLCHRDKPVIYDEVLRLWQTDLSFTDFFVELLAGSRFDAFRWETPPINLASVNRDFEFVLLECNWLDRPADRQSFSNRFESQPTNGVITFPNLGNDAMMVVPTPGADDSAFNHLAAFARHGPQKQVRELWRRVGQTMEESLAQNPIWLSTAGMGVSWLHVRLDTYPKYYGYAPYTRFDPDIG